MLSHFNHVQLCNTMDCSPPGSSVHGDSPGKNTGVDYHAFLQRIFLTQGSDLCLLWLLHCRWILDWWAIREAPLGYSYLSKWPLIFFRGKTGDIITEYTCHCCCSPSSWELGFSSNQWFHFWKLTQVWKLFEGLWLFFWVTCPQPPDNPFLVCVFIVNVKQNPEKSTGCPPI